MNLIMEIVVWAAVIMFYLVLFLLLDRAAKWLTKAVNNQKQRKVGISSAARARRKRERQARNQGRR